MIVVDSSALVAIAKGEPASGARISALAGEDEIPISAGTIAEALIVANRRSLREEMTRLFDDMGFRIMPVTEGSARRIAAAYDRRAKGVHPASLNFGDCFAYALAEEHGCELLFVGGDFAKTDLESVL